MSYDSNCWLTEGIIKYHEIHVVFGISVTQEGVGGSEAMIRKVASFSGRWWLGTPACCMTVWLAMMELWLLLFMHSIVYLIT